MSKAMFGIAAAVALVGSPAWAGDDTSDESAKAASDAVVSTDSTRNGESMGESKSAGDGVIEPGRSSADGGGIEQSDEVRASFEERWLREREGYRDGGY